MAEPPSDAVGEPIGSDRRAPRDVPRRGIADAPRRPAGLVLQRVVFDRPAPVAGLYLRARGGRTAERVQVQAGALRIPCGRTVSFDTYFNAFFEQPWRAHTRLGTVVLSVDAVGSFALRAFRRTLEGDDVLLEERVLADASGPVSVPLPPTPPGLNAASRLFFELTALPDGAVLRSAAWHSPDTSAEPVGLVAVFCTFDREPQLARVLATIGGDAEAVRALARVVVVSQGRPGLADHPGMARLPDPLRDRLEVIEQANFGGAGGFARGMLAATEVPGATHLVLMDDDVAAEPEGLRRAAAFFAIARPDLALGGHMLDLLQPTRLYEAGARIDPRRWYLEPLRMHLRLDDRRRLDELLDAAPMHYNGWWLFGLPLPLLDRAGLPLPCFIRGDDVEYGRRLHDRGLYTVGLPGVAIWHEPFYVKLGGWQLYYETRNMLVAAAVHFPRPAPGLAVLLLKRLLLYLLTYRYYSAALVLRAIEDYLRGPPVLEAPPQATHASLDRYSVEFPPAEVARERVAPEGRLLRDPRTLPGFVLRLVRAVLRNWAVPSEPASAPVRIEARDLVWFRVAKLDHVVAGTRWDARPPAFRRSRTAFRRLLARGVRLLLRVLREGTAAAEAWREAQPRLTSAGFWRGYLGLTQDTPAGAGGHRPWPPETRDACRPAAGEGAMGYRR